MIDRASLSSEHAQLDALAAQLLTLVTQPKPQSDALSSLRWRLNHVLMVHLAKEDKLLYPQLQANADPMTRALATRFATEMGGLAQTYLAFNSDWPIDRVTADWTGFGAATRVVMRALRKRIEREERDLYPRIAA